MKNLKINLKFFLFGFILAAFLNYIPSCSEKKSPVEPDDGIDTEYSENYGMQSLSDSLIAAFESNDKTKVSNFLSDESKDIYSNILNNSNENLSVFGDALAKRKLIFANELYAEYEITINENTYTISYANGGDSKWHLLRL